MDGEELYADQRQQQQPQRKPERFSGEVNISRVGAEEKKDASNPPAAAGRGGGRSSTIETGKKRTRGRPPGSKNKPKPAAASATPADAEPAPAMRPYILEIPGGGDVGSALAGFARRRGLGVCVLAGTGAVADVSLCRPSPSAEGGGGAAVVVFRGRHEILSISATYLPPPTSASVPRALGLGGLTVSLAGPRGQVLGGAVAGPLVAATTVVVVAATFTDPTFHRLSASVSVSGSGEADKRHGLQPEPPQGQLQASRLQPLSMAAAVVAADQPVSLYVGQSHVARAPAASKPRPRPPCDMQLSIESCTRHVRFL